MTRRRIDRCIVAISTVLVSVSSGIAGVACFEDQMVPCCAHVLFGPNLNRCCPQIQPDCAMCPDRIVANPSISRCFAVPYPDGFKETHTLPFGTCKWYGNWCDGDICREDPTPTTAICNSSKAINHACGE